MYDFEAISETVLPQLDICRRLPADIEPQGQTLVRLWGRPVGFLDMSVRRTEHELAAHVWTNLSLQIQRLLIDGGLKPIETLTPAGLDYLNPQWVEQRDAAIARGEAVTVVVCSRGRPASLRRALASLSKLLYADLEIVVVDNGIDGDGTAEVVHDASSTSRHDIRYVREARPGLSWARNAGIRAAQNEIIAFTDDDVVVDELWVAELVRAFSSTPDVGCVTGQVLPFEAFSDVSRWRESYAGANKYGFERKVFDLVSGSPSRLYPFTTGECGSGMNMAFRRDLLVKIGGFETALGAGTPSGGGEDLAIFFQVLSTGTKLLYEPAALVSHAHRPTYKELENQMRGWGSGLTAYLTHLVAARPRLALQLIARAGSGVAAAVSPSSWKNRRKPVDYPRSLTNAELLGMPAGPWLYLKGRRESNRLRRGLLP